MNPFVGKNATTAMINARGSMQQHRTVRYGRVALMCRGGRRVAKKASEPDGDLGEHGDALAAFDVGVRQRLGDLERSGDPAALRRDSEAGSGRRLDQRRILLPRGADVVETVDRRRAER